jgi:hypothetical protein
VSGTVIGRIGSHWRYPHSGGRINCDNGTYWTRWTSYCPTFVGMEAITAAVTRRHIPAIAGISLGG